MITGSAGGTPSTIEKPDLEDEVLGVLNRFLCPSNVDDKRWGSNEHLPSAIAATLVKVDMIGRTVSVWFDVSLGRRSLRGGRFRGARFAVPVVIVIATVCVVGALPRSSTSPANQGLSPSVVPGTYVDFSCVHASIAYDGSTLCSNGVTDIDTCDTPPSCTLTIEVGIDTGWAFSNFSVSGEVSIASEHGLNDVTITVYCPSSSGRYQGVFTVNTIPAADVTISVAMPTPGVSIGAVEIAGTYYYNGSVAILAPGSIYPISAEVLNSSFSFSQWSTNAGTISSGHSESTTFTVSGSGRLSLVLVVTGSWGGYLVSGIAAHSISADIDVPTCFTPDGCSSESPASSPTKTYEIPFWIGIGGFTNKSAMWQAGILVINEGEIYPWVEAVGGNCNQGTLGCSQKPNLNYSVSEGDTVSISLSCSAGTCGFTIRDQGPSNVWSWTGSDSFSPSSTTAEWVCEVSSTYAPLPFSNASFTNLEVNSDSITLGLEPTLAMEGMLGTFYVSPSYVSVSGGSSTFYVSNLSTRGPPS